MRKDSRIIVVALLAANIFTKSEGWGVSDSVEVAINLLDEAERQLEDNEDD